MVTTGRPPGFRPAVDDEVPFDATRAEQSLPDAFRTVVTEHGDRAAVIDGDGITSYDELDARSDAVARAVADVTTDAPVVVVAGHGAAAVTAMIGIAKAGATYAVIDGAAPEAYRHDVVDRLGARIIVTDRAHAPHAPNLTTIVVDDLPAAAFVPSSIAPDAPLSISFTSGSSGTPKAVVHSHRNVVHNALRIGAVFALHADDRFLAASSFQYTASATVVYSSLLAGAAVWPYDFAALGTTRFEHGARAVGLTIVQLTPALTGALAKHAGVDGVPTVRIASVGGDRLDLRQVHELHTAFPRATIYYRYNTSETNWIAGAVIDPDGCDARGRAPVGWPVPWVEVTVRDERGEPVTQGEVGELCATSSFLALGYWGDDARTAASFATTPSGRVYATGDRVRQDADGLLEVVGRDDTTVKIRGVLVDTALVEREIERLPDVRATAVVSYTEAESTRLAAFVVTEGDNARGVDVRSAVAAALPRGMVPQTVRTLDALPSTARGKVDTAALRNLLEETEPGAAGAPAPTDDMLTRRVAARMAEVLGLDAVGPHDDFFALGGDSLSSVELAAALRLDHGVEPEFSALLEHPTAASLAGWIRAATPPRRDLARLTRGTDAQIPVVFFAGGGGAAMVLVQPIARALHERTAYVVIPHALEHRGFPDRTVTKKATRAADALLALDPQARFALIGQSSGGNTAVATAVALAARGHEPPLVVLLDTNGPDRARFRRLREHCAGARLECSSRLRLALRYMRLALVTEAHETYLCWTAGVVRRVGREQVRAFRALMRSALVHERPRPYSGRVLLLRAMQRPSNAMGPTSRDLDWAPHLTGEFTIVDVPGGHVSMTEAEHLPDAVAAIEALLSEIEPALTRP